MACWSLLLVLLASIISQLFGLTLTGFSENDVFEAQTRWQGGEHSLPRAPTANFSEFFSLNETTHENVSDKDLAKVDLVRAFLRMNLLPRLRYP